MIRTDGTTLTFSEQATPPDAPPDGARLFLDDEPKFQVVYPDGYVIPAELDAGAMSEEVPFDKVTTPVASWSLSGWTQDSDYDELHIIWGVRHDNASGQTQIIRPNASATASHYYGAMYYSSVSSGVGAQVASNNTANGLIGGATSFYLGTGLQSANLFQTHHLIIHQYNKASAVKFWEMQIQGWFSTANAWNGFATGKFLDTGNAITSLYITFGAGNIDTGSWYKAWVQ